MAAHHYLLLLLLWSGLLLGDSPIHSVLNQAEAPPGILFEVVEDDADALDWALPEIIKLSQLLRGRFPGLDIAVVSHGREEFALQTLHQQSDAELHQQVQNLRSENIPVHICETHAGWYGVQAEDFPDYVDVVPAGPVQIELYEQMGFIVIRLESPE